ncbi:hypothetical protein [Massilia varians]|uniref:hypothetical protein n=1 Tax=Massilia varians TaxID=457921 RepID=UPI002492B72B|nr:hypothetical protein [Massilia varians]
MDDRVDGLSFHIYQTVNRLVLHQDFRILAQRACEQNTLLQSTRQADTDITDLAAKGHVDSEREARLNKQGW